MDMGVDEHDARCAALERHGDGAGARARRRRGWLRRVKKGRRWPRGRARRCAPVRRSRARSCESFHSVRRASTSTPHTVVPTRDSARRSARRPWHALLATSPSRRAPVRPPRHRGLARESTTFGTGARRATLCIIIIIFVLRSNLSAHTVVFVSGCSEYVVSCCAISLERSGDKIWRMYVQLASCTATA
jgi:hypothetical protein